MQLQQLLSWRGQNINNYTEIAVNENTKINVKRETQ